MNSMANNKNECPLDHTGDCCTRAGLAELPSCSASSLSGPTSYLSSDVRGEGLMSHTHIPEEQC